ncbi:beta-ketoacyl synthase chain length factor [Chitinophaga sancti]|uniref:Beta-ketoacyl synthase chain length factor n=2 Tax=Chitinophaga sancti TaxID=1004 RepID=A0ABZ0XEN6_9BACT|nr:beta-ketoacyl synthase chain length factor [Chitinophaga sancti]WQD65628.1 beta-ketoacyl synthase chain length factor [Chitinophaga sancti]WQG88749.1 beta-ketoacyl synthase chain length factor [Chitinophaga sancti]
MKGKYYIQGMSAISPQHSFGEDIFSQPLVTVNENVFACVEPDYRAYMPPNSVRRLTRILKVGLTAALQCMQSAGVAVPGAIVTGTGKGSLSDTERFLKEIREYKETALNATPFIQSTYNAVNGLIALQQKCTQYNNTFVHRGFSFENALLDAMLLLSEGNKDILVGAFEEITAEHFYIKSRIGCWKKEKIASNELYQHPTPGSISGEGAAFFLLSDQPGKVQLSGLKMVYKPKEPYLDKFLASHNISLEDIDLVISGRNGDSNFDHYYEGLPNELPFKHLCGEYDTAGAFALWLGAQIIKAQQIPANWFPMLKVPAGPYKNILIYNHFFGEQHVYMLLTLNTGYLK